MFRLCCLSLSLKRDLRATSICVWMRISVTASIAVALWSVGAHVTYAGCQHASVDSASPVGEHTNLSTHRRDFRSAWQWVYEAGQGKFMPVQKRPVCQGPHCQSKDELPTNRLIVPLEQHRPSVYCILNGGYEAHFRNALGIRKPDDECARSGYPQRLDEPPRSFV